MRRITQRTSRGRNGPRPGSAGRVQGEADYAAARRYERGLKYHLQNGDLEKAAREAAPHTARDARELEAAEEAGRRHALPDSGGH